MSYLYQIFWRHSWDVCRLILNNFRYVVCLSVCPLPHFLTESRLYLDISGCRWAIFFNFFGDIPWIFLHYFQNIMYFLYVCQSVLSLLYLFQMVIPGGQILRPLALLVLRFNFFVFIFLFLVYELSCSEFLNFPLLIPNLCSYLVERSHAGHVDPINVNVDAHLRKVTSYHLLKSYTSSPPSPS